MERRQLGNSGLEVSVMGLGTMTFGGQGMYSTMGGLQEAEARTVVHRCIDAGITLFDTADVYSDGLSEELLGRALTGRRNNVVVATKCFGRTGTGEHDAGLSRRHVVEACEASLRRLGTDWIDLYQVHGFDAKVPLEETVRALDILIRDGKVRYVGCSNHSGWHLLKALAVADALGVNRYVSQQIQYSLLAREAENELLPAGLDQSVGGIIWGPLAAGYLTGKFRAGPVTDAARLGVGKRLARIDTTQARQIVSALSKIAEERSSSISRIALAWLFSRSGVSSILIGARTLAQLDENIAASTLSLSPEEIESLDRVSQTEEPYPYSHQRVFAADRNPPIFKHYRGP